MKNTHTPGPWEVRNGCNVFANASHVPLTNDGLIAVTGGLSGRDTIDRDAANARLIAEAPAMADLIREFFLAAPVDADAMMRVTIEQAQRARAILARIDARAG